MAPSAPEPTQQAPNRPHATTLRWVAGTLLLLFVGLPLCLFLMVPLGMSGRACGAGGLALTCSSAVQMTLIYLPLGGLVVGLLVCVLGGLRRRSAGRSPARAVGLGWAVFVVLELAVLLLARH